MRLALLALTLPGERSRRGNLKWRIAEPLILLVEDEPLLLLISQDALEAGGYAVVPVQSGSEAVSVLDGRTHELSGLVTDIRMPGGIDGWAVARHAREAQPDLPIVYTTGDSASDWPALGVPNSVVVRKPYAGAQLLTAISTLITKADTNRTS